MSEAHQPQQPPSMRGLGIVAAVCAAIGLVTVLATMAWGHIGKAPNGATEEYGRRLIAQTTEYLGPDALDPKMRYTNSRLACGSCHIGAGTEPGNLSLMTAITKYPRISPRSGTNETIQDRINGCMIRSMNGRALRDDSPEMIAMVSYLRFLNDEDAAMGASMKKAHDGPAFKTPKRKANLENGEQVFEKRCASCHGKDGAGLLASTKPIEGFLFPPLWGANTFNDGAGMHRVLTAARFVKAKMPLGKADLDDDDAFDVAAYFNSRPRPEMANLDRDYPDRKKKPIDTSYGPYADPFPQEQHQFGPFPPIEAYYKKP
jgi:thiosulfate dehydrogenase